MCSVVVEARQEPFGQHCPVLDRQTKGGSQDIFNDYH